MRFSYALYTIHEGMGLIIGYLILVFFRSWPYHPDLCYIPCLKTTLRPWHQTLSLKVFTRANFCRLVEVQSLLYFLLWEILLKAFGCFILLGILIFDGFSSLETVHWWSWIHPFLVHQISTLGHIFPFAMRSLDMVGLCGYSRSWLLRCLIDVSRWFIDDDRCLAGGVIFFVVYQISIVGHILPLFDEVWSGGSTRIDDWFWLYTLWLWHQTLYWGIFLHFLWVSLRLGQRPAWF